MEILGISLVLLALLLSDTYGIIAVIIAMVGAVIVYKEEVFALWKLIK